MANKQKFIPAKKHMADIIYTIIFGAFNLASIYVNGPMNIVSKTIIDTIMAKLAITHYPHPRHSPHNLRRYNLHHHMDSILYYIFPLLLPYVLR